MNREIILFALLDLSRLFREEPLTVPLFPFSLFHHSGFSNPLSSQLNARGEESIHDQFRLSRAYRNAREIAFKASGSLALRRDARVNRWDRQTDKRCDLNSFEMGFQWTWRISIIPTQPLWCPPSRGGWIELCGDLFMQDWTEGCESGSQSVRQSIRKIEKLLKGMKKCERAK